MKILIVGSLRHLNGVERDRAEDACEQIGNALATEGHSLVLGSESLNTADHHVFKGAVNLMANSIHVLIVRPYSNRQLFRAYRGQRNLHITENYFAGIWLSVRYRQIAAADAVLIIGGNHSPRDVIAVASTLGRTVFPIPAFRGGAEWAFEYAELDLSFLSHAEWQLLSTWSGAHSINIIVTGLNRLRPRVWFRLTRQFLIFIWEVTGKGTKALLLAAVGAIASKVLWPYISPWFGL